MRLADIFLTFLTDEGKNMRVGILNRSEMKDTHLSTVVNPPQVHGTSTS